MRILLCNDDYFRDSLLRLGAEVFYVGPSPNADLQTGQEPVEINEILKGCPFEPEFILVSDSIDLRSAFLGLHRTAIPKAFYGVDAPMNGFWQQDFAQFFDLAFLDQKSQVETLWKLNSQEPDRFHWLPLAADHRIYRKLDVDKIFDVAFVGTLNDRLRPKRSWLIKELQRRFKLTVFDGNGNRSLPPEKVVQIYNQARIVLNENLFPGVNLRTFEVMACGSCLLTEYSDGSWSSFFQDGEHLVAFKPENLIEKTSKLLEDETERERIAAQGRELILREHTIDHRAARLLELMTDYLPRHRSRADEQQRNFHLGKACIALSIRWAKQPIGRLKNHAVKLLLNLTSQQWESAELHFELGAQALTESRIKDAVNSFQRSLQIDSGHLRSHWGLFWCLLETGEAANACEEMKIFSHHLRMRNRGRSIFKHIASGIALSAADYLFFAELLEKAGWDLDPGIDRMIDHPCRWNAFDAYQQAITLDPKFGAAYAKCAALLEKNQLPEFAVFLAQKAAELQPWNSDLKLLLGALLLNSHRREEGLLQIVQYLVRSSDPDKWEKVERTIITDVEWLTILNRVWDSCQESENLPPTQNGVLKVLAELSQPEATSEEKYCS